MGGKSKVDMKAMSIMEILAAAFGGAAIAEVVTLPLDTIKVQMQVYQGKYSGGLQCAKQIIADEGGAALFKGCQAGLMRQFFYGTLRIGIYDYANGWLQSKKGLENITILDRIGLGIFSGSLAMLVGNPADVVKVRFQSDSAKNPRYKSLVDAFVKIGKKEGFKGFYQSLPANLVRNSVTNAAELVSYDQIRVSFLKNGWMEDGMPLHFVASGLAGFITTVLSSPVDVLKTKIMSGKVMPDGTKVMYKSMGHALKDIVHESGFKGFYKGFNANCQRIISWNIIMFVAREQILLHFYSKHKK